MRIPNPKGPTTLLHTFHCKQGTNSHLSRHRFHLVSNFIDLILITVLSLSSQSRYTASCAHATASYCTLNSCQTRAASNYSTGRMKNVAKPFDLLCAKLEHFLKYSILVTRLGQTKVRVFLPCIAFRCTVNVQLKGAKNKLDRSTPRDWRSSV